MKETLFSRYERYITALLETSDSEEDDDTHVTEEDYRGLLKKVHTNEVKDALDNRDNNKVLDEPAPKLSKDELRLPRGTRRTLGQLRSGYSQFLQSYLHRLDESTPETCPQCNSETHTTGHLFRCSANPTTITPHALWETRSKLLLSCNSIQKKPQMREKRRAEPRAPRQQQQQEPSPATFPATP